MSRKYSDASREKFLGDSDGGSFAVRVCWPGVRPLPAAQQSVAEGEKFGAWVDTDDLNGPNDGLHYTKDGYTELGHRFAAKAGELIRKSEAAPK